MAAGKVIEAQRKVQRGTSTPKKANARHRFAKSVQRAKQKRRRRQAVNRRIWQELRATTQKWEDPETPAVQPVNVQSGEVNERPVDGNPAYRTRRPSLGLQWATVPQTVPPRWEDQRTTVILLKIKIQIQGRTYVALVDSGASRNYASPEAVDVL